VAAYLAGEFRFQVGQADVVTPAAGVDQDGMRTPAIAAVDDEPGRAGLSHFPERDFLSALPLRWASEARPWKAWLSYDCASSMRDTLP
jgi:hypothetical protein